MSCQTKFYCSGRRKRKGRRQRSDSGACRVWAASKDLPALFARRRSAARPRSTRAVGRASVCFSKIRAPEGRACDNRYPRNPAATIISGLSVGCDVSICAPQNTVFQGLFGMYALYSLLTAAGMVLLSPYFLIRGLIDGKYLGHVRERLGWGFPQELRLGSGQGRNEGTIWIHAVSVGEVLAAYPLAKQLKERHRDSRLVVSTTTATGQKLARERMQFADAIFYFPLDWRGPVRRAIKMVRPAAAIIVETEIWPNFLRECRRAGVPVIFVNGRLSEKSFRGFRRAIVFSCGVLRGFLKRILSDAALFLMQSEQDASRLLDLGAEPKRVIVAGNLKYDLGDPAESPLSEWLAGELVRNHRQPVLVAGIRRGRAGIPARAVDSRAAQAGPLRRSGKNYRGIAARAAAPKQPQTQWDGEHGVVCARQRVVAR